MPQIYIMAAITLAAALALWSGLVYLFTSRQKHFLWLLPLGLPFSAVANLLIKPWAVIGVGRFFQVEPGLGLAAPVWFLAFKVIITPLVEEVIKVLPLLILPVWKMVSSKGGALWVGFVLGISFGLGEALFIAYSVGQNGLYDALPWYAFTGFFNERLMTCFTHGVLSAITVIGLKRGGRFILSGYLCSVGLHLFLNAPVVMYQFKWISNTLYNILLIIPFIVLAVIFERIRRETRNPQEDQTGNEVLYWQRGESK
jgi:hypothetical protein